MAGSECGSKSSFAKKSECSKENSLLQAKMFWGFMKLFSEFTKGIYKTCDRNFFNLTLSVVVVFLSVV